MQESIQPNWNVSYIQKINKKNKKGWGRGRSQNNRGRTENQFPTTTLGDYHSSWYFQAFDGI